VDDPTVRGRSGAGGDGGDGGPTLVLASGSPRRLELLARLGLAPVVRPAHLDETPQPGEAPDALVIRLATSKAAASAAAGEPGADEVVLAADTEVVLDGRALGKPADADEAAAMLHALAGRTHAVVTGLAVRRGERVVTDRVTTEVTFRALTAEEIAWYVATGEPDDKAGAYAIQGTGAVLVDRIDGSDTNVIGLPLPATVALLRAVGFDPLATPDAACGPVRS
jgi:septum formation protein